VDGRRKSSTKRYLGAVDGQLAPERLDLDDAVVALDHIGLRAFAAGGM
jgi:hypothetical protein